MHSLFVLISQIHMPTLCILYIYIHILVIKQYIHPEEYPHVCIYIYTYIYIYIYVYVRMYICVCVSMLCKYIAIFCLIIHCCYQLFYMFTIYIYILSHLHPKSTYIRLLVIYMGIAFGYGCYYQWIYPIWQLSLVVISHLFGHVWKWCISIK